MFSFLFYQHGLFDTLRGYKHQQRATNKVSPTSTAEGAFKGTSVQSFWDGMMFNVFVVKPKETTGLSLL